MTARIDRDRPLAVANRLAVLAMWPVALSVYALAARGLLGCGFRSLTGLPCPFCGTTHALSALLMGRGLTSLGWHPLILPGVVLALAQSLVHIAELVGRTSLVPMRVWDRCWWWLFGLICLTWVGRLLALLLP
ncbi:MAG: DUF2752 domain-containing protein [Candidatus Riflebacteria bacterium]|nr:DUF2752 domain-containing protein [Candidatus Riflebacteria bacterium]